MDVRAIILVGAETEAPSTSTTSQDIFLPEQLMGVPIAALDLLGQPVVCHVIDRLRNCGVGSITVLTSVPADPEASLRNRLPAGVQHEEVAVEGIWDAAESLFLRMSKGTADTVLILRIGAYIEVDFNQLLKFHLSRRNCATTLANQFQEQMDILALDASRAEEAAVVLQRKMQWNWRPSEILVSYGYFNPLSNARDFRRLAEDGLMRRCALIPKAHEIRPGVWLGKNARLHDSVQVEGPVFIGKQAKVREGAVLMGCSAIEADSQIDTGTSIDNSSVLPQTYIGKNLNLVQSVAGLSQIVQVDRNVAVHIADERLTRRIPPASFKTQFEPLRAGLFLVKRAVSVNPTRVHSTPEPMPTLNANEQTSVTAKAARAQAAAASGSRIPKKDLK